MRIEVSVSDMGKSAFANVERSLSFLLYQQCNRQYVVFYCPFNIPVGQLNLHFLTDLMLASSWSLKPVPYFACFVFYRRRLVIDPASKRLRREIGVRSMICERKLDCLC